RSPVPPLVDRGKVRSGTMSGDFTPILILVGVAGLICAAMVTLSWLLGPKKVTPYKLSPYECGVEPVGSARERFPVKFYLVAMLFILFDIEVVFLWSWLTVFKDPGMGSASADLAFQWFSFWAIMIYMALWIVGDAYVLKINAIDWDESTFVDEREGLQPVGSA
ncbi:MAG TPA: NADH-quinone oxidoreductase subunit A, partial [Fimbriimonadaceae bacterium]|nr:NADH-quinone oxidoreductase subunit A [Fimbriimonadaceae bacterium]